MSTVVGRKRAAVIAVPLTVLGLLAASLSNGTSASAAGGTAKPPPGAVAPFVIPTLPDPTLTVAPSVIHGFEDSGFIASATVATDNSMCPNTANPAAGTVNRLGGTLTINSGPIVIPCNTVVQLPANTMTWADFVNNGADLTLGHGYPSFEMRAVGNIVGDRRIAGLLYASQQLSNAATGVITSIDYTTGNLSVETGDAAKPVTVQLNDPNGRFGRPQSPDARFSVDDTNPTVHAGTGYPMCIPRTTTDPTVAGNPDDALCPQANRPTPSASGQCRNFSIAGIAPPASGELSPAPAGQAYCSGWVMPAAPADGSATTGPDPRQQAPFEVGDSIHFAGTLVHPDAGPDYVSAHTVEANIGIFTMPETQPSYVAIGDFGVGTADPSAVSISGFAVETQDRIFLESETTDIKTPVDIYMTDVNPLTGSVRNRWVTPFAMTGEQNGPNQADGVTPIGGGITTQNTGPQPQRARIRASKAPAGLLSQPSRTVRVAQRSLCVPQAPVDDANGVPVLTALDTCLNSAAKSANGLMAGEYTAPTFAFIFPENVKPGDPLVPFDFWHLPFLRYGEGASTSSPIGPGVGPLEPAPWGGPSASVPGAPTIGAATAADSTASVTWTPPAFNGGIAITAYTVTAVDAAGNPAGTGTVTGGTTSATLTGLTNGQTYRLSVTATNFFGTGPSSALSNPVTVSAPATVTAPTATLSVPSGPVSTTAVPVTLSWTGVNTIGYELQQSLNGAPFADIAGCTAAAPCAGSAAVVNLRPSATNQSTVTTYRYQVRAANPVGAFSAYVSGPLFSIPATDNTGGFSFAGGWSGVNLAGAYNGSVNQSSTTGATAQNSTALSGATVAWVSTTGPDRGMATISVDGGAAQTVDLYSATLKPATLVWKATGLGTAAGHTIKVTVLSTRNPASTGNKVDIDAYLGLK
jgi:hypothetical protein